MKDKTSKSTFFSKLKEKMLNIPFSIAISMTICTIIICILFITVSVNDHISKEDTLRVNTKFMYVNYSYRTKKVKDGYKKEPCIYLTCSDESEENAYYIDEDDMQYVAKSLLDSLKYGDEIVLLLHPTTKSIMELSKDGMMILSFKDTVKSINKSVIITSLMAFISGCAFIFFVVALMMQSPELRRPESEYEKSLPDFAAARLHGSSAIKEKKRRTKLIKYPGKDFSETVFSTYASESGYYWAEISPCQAEEFSALVDLIAPGEGVKVIEYDRSIPALLYKKGEFEFLIKHVSYADAKLDEAQNGQPHLEFRLNGEYTRMVAIYQKECENIMYLLGKVRDMHVRVLAGNIAAKIDLWEKNGTIADNLKDPLSDNALDDFKLLTLLLVRENGSALLDKNNLALRYTRDGVGYVLSCKKTNSVGKDFALELSNYKSENSSDASYRKELMRLLLILSAVKALRNEGIKAKDMDPQPAAKIQYTTEPIQKQADAKPDEQTKAPSAEDLTEDPNSNCFDVNVNGVDDKYFIHTNNSGDCWVEICYYQTPTAFTMVNKEIFNALIGHLAKKHGFPLPKDCEKFHYTVSDNHFSLDYIPYVDYLIDPWWDGDPFIEFSFVKKSDPRFDAYKKELTAILEFLSNCN